MPPLYSSLFSRYLPAGTTITKRGMSFMNFSQSSPCIDEPCAIISHSSSTFTLNNNAYRSAICIVISFSLLPLFYLSSTLHVISIHTRQSLQTGNSTLGNCESCVLNFICRRNFQAHYYQYILIWRCTCYMKDWHLSRDVRMCCFDLLRNYYDVAAYFLSFDGYVPYSPQYFSLLSLRDFCDLFLISRTKYKYLRT